MTGERRNGAQIVALVGAAVAILGAFGPWESSVFVSRAGVETDGLITLALAVAAALMLYLARPDSDWLAMAATLGLFGAAVGVYDLIKVSGSSSELFGRQIQLFTPGWGLWLTVAGCVLLTVASIASRVVGSRH